MHLTTSEKKLATTDGQKKKLENRKIAVMYVVRFFTEKKSTRFDVNMTEDFSPKALIIVERLLELLG